MCGLGESASNMLPVNVWVGKHDALPSLFLRLEDWETWDLEKGHGSAIITLSCLSVKLLPLPQFNSRGYIGR